MLILKFLQSLVKALNSDGTPGQVGMGMALGLALGLTPLASLHNLVVLAVAMLTTVSFPGVMLGWLVAVPIGFLLDPVFDRVGMMLLSQDALAPFFTCPRCSGKGTVVVRRMAPPEDSRPRVFTDHCRWCHGKGRVTLWQRLTSPDVVFIDD